MRCPSFLWFFVQVKLGQNLPCPVVMARQGKADRTKLALPCYFLVICGDGKARQGRKICSALQLWLCVAMAR